MPFCTDLFWLGELRIDTDERNYVAAVVDIGGPDGIVVEDGTVLVRVWSKTQSGKYLYLTSKVFIIGDFLSVRWVCKVIKLDNI